MTRPELTLVRHGETEWSRAGLHTGRTDVALTDLGRRQAEALGAMLEGAHFSRVLSSPLSRAKETMEIAGRSAGALTVPDLVEWDYGAFEGRSTAEAREEIPGWSVWTHPIPGGESVEDVGTRLDRVIAQVEAVPGHVLVFGHGHALRVLAARWIGLPPGAGQSLALATATVSTLGWERETRVIRQWNEACHLRPREEPIP